LIFLAGCFALPVEEEMPPLPMLAVTDPIEWRTAAVSRGDVMLDINLTARYIPVRQERVTFSKAGYIVEGVFVSEGDMVYEGQILASFIVPELNEQLDEARRVLSRMVLQISQLTERHEHSLNAAYITGTWLDDSQYISEMERLTEQTAHMRLEINYLLEHDEARHARSPMHGVATSVMNIIEGQTSTTHGVVATVVDMTETIFTVSQLRDLDFIIPGDLFDMTVMQDGVQFDVIVEAVDSEELGIPRQSRVAYFTVISEYHLVFDSSTTGNITYVFGKVNDVIAIPTRLVQTIEERSFVYVLVNNVRRLRYVEIGLQAPDYTEIIGGLEEGELIII